MSSGWKAQPVPVTHCRGENAPSVEASPAEETKLTESVASNQKHPLRSTRINSVCGSSSVRNRETGRLGWIYGRFGP